MSSEVQINYKVESEPWPLIITKRSIYSEQASPIVEARLAREPLVLFDKPNSTRFEAVLLSPPKFISAPIVLHDENKNKFEIEPLETAEGAACLLRSSLHLSAEDPLRPLSPILNFLTFMKGCHCGLGNLFAYDEEDAVAFRLLGFSHSDVEKRETNWFDIEIQKNLPEIFTLFSGAFSDDLTGRALRQTVSFYRASNASRSVSVEMSIIAAHSALESIVNFVLEHRAGWSKSMMNNRSIAFSDKSRAAAQHFGVCTELLSQSPELAAFSIGSNGIDVFEIISRFRNKLVHQDAKHSPTGIQLHETWLIAQWLVEVLVFGVIGYRGDIIDRRVYKGWRGTTCKVPLSRS
ncbi:MAG: hypothetical protein GJ678_08925 [Rhodobacteraceae bacterium]|nr:hypothetical protein [Paracoccaceae bacterium]